jgi:hypothetical protein
LPCDPAHLVSRSLEGCERARLRRAGLASLRRRCEEAAMDLSVRRLSARSDEADLADRSIAVDRSRDI